MFISPLSRHIPTPQSRARPITATLERYRGCRYLLRYLLIQWRTTYYIGAQKKKTMRRLSLRFVGNLIVLAIIIDTSCHGLVLEVPTQRNLNNRHATIHSTRRLEAATTVASQANTAAANIVDEQLARQLGSAFAQKLLELEEYKMKYGDCLVPRRYEDNPSLGNFVNKQRQSYRKFVMGEKSSMNDVSSYCAIYNASSICCIYEHMTYH